MQDASMLGESRSTVEAPAASTAEQDDVLLEVDTSTPLRPLTSLRWPYVPEESAYPDPLKRDDPKSLQLYQYEAIGKFLMV